MSRKVQNKRREGRTSCFEFEDEAVDSFIRGKKYEEIIANFEFFRSRWSLCYLNSKCSYYLLGAYMNYALKQLDSQSLEFDDEFISELLAYLSGKRFSPVDLIQNANSYERMLISQFVSIILECLRSERIDTSYCDEFFDGLLDLQMELL